MNWFANLLKPLARGMALLSPSCKQAARLQSEALDRKLSASQRLGLRIHLLLCKWCRRYGGQIRFLHDAAQDYPEQLTTPGTQKLSEEARQRITRKLREEAG